MKGQARDFRTPAKKAILNALKTLSTNSTSFPKNWQQDIFPYFFGNAFNLQESDFLPLKFERLNGVPCWNQLCCDDSVRPMYEQTFFGLKKIWQGISPLTCIYFVNSIAEALTDAPATLYQWDTQQPQITLFQSAVILSLKCPSMTCLKSKTFN